ncbi:hypothetical protein HDV05_006055 [Chytridiales sp. JEL 0842]|nr:hypothetical protein HDV05_006055 [Chytridiales sp. JEL 0842]
MLVVTPNYQYDAKKSSMGKMASEIITNTVASYLDKIITLIYKYKGDIIRFLGDAVLICFQKGDDEAESAPVERALACCTTILVEYSLISIDLGEAVQQQKRLTTDSEQTVIQTATVKSGNQPHLKRGSEASPQSGLARTQTVERKASILVPASLLVNAFSMGNSRSASDSPPGARQEEARIVLTIHVAITAGSIFHTVIGSDDRMDYCVHGPCLETLGEVLDGAEGGQLGVSKEALEVMSSRMKAGLPLYADRKNEFGIFLGKQNLQSLAAEFLQTEAKVGSGREKGLSNPADASSPVESLNDNCLPGATSDVSMITKSWSTEAVELLEKFINPSLLRKLKTADELARRTTAAGRRATHRKNVYRSTAEFRTVSIIFVKIKSEFSPDTAQVCMSTFAAILKKYEGVFQQYSVDDKGQTMLACFGLPPWTHEKEAKHALKAAVEFSTEMERRGETHLAISVASGDLLYSKLGNNLRSDASLLGDVVNLAARLLGIPSEKAAVRCCRPTFTATREDFHHVHLGAHKVKGKTEPVDVWAVSAKSETLALVKEVSTLEGGDRHISEFFGYAEERSKLTFAMKTWLDASLLSPAYIVFEGKSGMGKSKLLDYTLQHLNARRVSYTITQGSEVKQFTPYFAIQSMMNFIFRRHIDPADFENDSHEEIDDSFSKDPVAQKGTHSKIAERRVSSSTRQTTSSKNSIMLNEDTQSLMHISRQHLPNFIKTESSEESNVHNRMVKKFLSIMGENPIAAPLISTVLPFITITENHYTKKMDAQTRGNLLKSMVVRIVAKSLNYEPFAAIFDDSQWLDLSSLDIIQAIVKSGAPIFLTMFCRPLQDYKVDMISRLIQSTQTLHFQLNGLTLEDTTAIMKHKLESLASFDCVDSEVAKVLFEKSEGLPLLLDSILETLKGQFYNLFIIEDGRLLFAQKDGATAVGKVSTVGAATIAQFDKLPEVFQDILRKSSILGQYFNLNDLTYFLEDDIIPDEIEAIITSNDPSSNFLIKQTVENGEVSYAYYWRHIQMMQAVYSSQSYKERNSLHELVSEFYESSLTEANEDFLLPTVIYHFLRTQKVEKQVFYLNNVGMKYFSKAHFIEAAKSFEELVSIVDSHPELDINDLNLASWLAHFAYSRMESKVFNVKDLCCRCLSLLKNPWPADEKQVKKAVLKAAIRLFKMWRKTRGGTEPPRNWIERLSRRGSDESKPLDDIELRKYVTLKMCIRVLFRVGLYGGALSKQENVLALFSMCNAIITRGFETKVEWAGVCYLVAFGTAWGPVGLSKIFFEKALSIDKTLADKQGLSEFYQVAGSKHYTLANLREAEECYDEFIK